MEIAFCRRDVFVAGKFLEGERINPCHRHVRNKGVAKRVEVGSIDAYFFKEELRLFK